MTPEQQLQSELVHLLNLCAPPLTRGWWPYCKAKANALAATDPKVFADLPKLLEEGVRNLNKPGLERPSTKGASDE